MRIASAIVFTLVVLKAQGQSPMYRGNAQLTGVVETPAPATLSGMKFSFKTDGAIRSTAAEVGGALYFGSEDGSLYSIDRKSGDLRWKFKTNGPVNSSPAVAGNIVYFTSRDGMLYAVNASSGKEQWRFKIGNDLPYANGWDYYLSSPVVVDQNVFVGSGDGNLYAINIASRKPVWTFNAGARIRTTPAVIGNHVVFGAMDGFVYSISKDKGAMQWKFATHGTTLAFKDFGFDATGILSSPSVTDETVLIGARDGFLYAIDIATGKEKWKANHDGSWVLGTAIQNGTAFAASGSAAFVQALDLTTGTEKWRFKTAAAIFSSLAVAGDMIYFDDYVGNLYAVNNKTGKLRWKFPMGKRSFSAPVVSNGIVYASSDEGVLFALEGDATNMTLEHTVAKKVVFWQGAATTKGFNWFANAADIVIRDYFKNSGYEVLGESELKSMMEQQLTTKTPSVVVFATSRIPESIIESVSEKALLRRYLDAGGKVVYLSPDPLAYHFDSSGGVDSINFQWRPMKITGIQYEAGGNINHGAMLGSRPTAEGTKWGLRGWWVAPSSVGASQVTTVLARNEYGEPSAWVKSFGGPPGTGLVQLFAPKDGVGNDLYSIKSVVEYGLEW